MNIKLRYKILAAALLWAWFGLFIWYKTKQADKALTNRAMRGILPKDDSEQIIVNPNKHQLIVIKAGQKPIVTTLPDRVSTIDIHKDNTVTVSSAQYGFEEKPFIGTQGSDRFRFMAGSDQLFYKKLDLGLALGVQPNLVSLVGIVQVSYEVWSNTRIGITFDTDQHVGVGISVRL